MTAALHPTAPPTLALLPAWRKVLPVLGANAAIWIALTVLGTLTSLNSDLSFGVEGSLWLIFLSSCKTSLALACLSLILYLGFGRWPGIIANARTIALGFVVVMLVLLPSQLTFVAKAYLFAGASNTLLDAIDAYRQALPVVHWTSIMAVYFAVVAVKIWQQSQARARAWAQAQAAAQALQLGLERQRALALRAQLEPHFMFNALNAISAMVRTDKDVALDGIQGLSDLLRYALAAGERDWVKLSDELGFIEDYLTLQRMRYGARLKIAIEGASAAVLDCDCPPLLLQPLIENALRHDLDCHASASDILLALELRAGQLCVRVSNPVHREAAHNPGVGLGLRNIEGRLQLAYGGAAIMQAGVAGDRFEVILAMPSHAPD
jgi:two-component system sensor histidine kinase AlgZ